MLSEVGYYLDAADLERLLDLVQLDLRPGGTVVACHWRHPVEDYRRHVRRPAARSRARHGANLGTSAAAYLDAGGVPPLALAETGGFADHLRRLGQ